MRTIRGIGAATGALLFAACASTPTDGTAASAPTETAATDTGAATDGALDLPPPPAADGGGQPPTAPADEPRAGLSGRRLDGGTFDGAAVTGDVVVWFWTPW